MRDTINESRIGPCGMNCGICYAFLRPRNTCPGCRLFNAEEPVSIAGCKIRRCPQIASKAVHFCFECAEYPCKNLKNLDKRYRSKYNMSEIANLELIQQKGIAALVEQEKEKWTCRCCGATINVHTQSCSECDHTIPHKNS